MIVDNKECYLCGSDKYKLINKGVRDNSTIDVLECNNCQLIRLSSFSGISDTYYEESKMHQTITSIEECRKITRDDDNRRYQLLEKLVENKNVLDFGCGNGGFLRLIENISKNITGIDLEERMIKELQKENVECYQYIEQMDNRGGRKFDIITLFHVLEHLSEPILLINELKSLLAKDGMIVIEVPNANDALLSLYENKKFAEFTYWSCHLYLYNANTLSILAKKCGMKVEFIKHVQRYPLVNHLYWLAKGLPGGHTNWIHVNNKELDCEYEKMLAGLGMTDTVVMGMKIAFLN